MSTIPFSNFFKYKYKDDAQLVADLISGNPKAIVYVFYSQFTPLLMSNARKIIRQRPIEFDDLIQDFYLYLSQNNWERLKTFDPKKNKFITWLSVVSFRRFRDYCEKWVVDNTDFDSDNPILTHERSNDDWQNSELYYDLVRVLEFFQPPRDRDILKALLIDDEKSEDVAKRYGIKRASVDSIKCKALARLIKYYLTGYKNN